MVPETSNTKFGSMDLIDKVIKVLITIRKA